MFEFDLFSGDTLQLHFSVDTETSKTAIPHIRHHIANAARSYNNDLLNNHYLLGGQIKPQVTLIDWLTITIPDSSLFGGTRQESQVTSYAAREVYTAKAKQLAKLAGLRLRSDIQTGRNRYKQRYDLLASDGHAIKGSFITFGGNGGLCMSLSGQACRIAFATEAGLKAVGNQLVKDKAQIAQIHIALDAGDGEFTAASVVGEYRADKTIFRVRGKGGRLPRVEWTVVDEPTGERINRVRVGGKAKDAKKYQTFYEKPDGRTRAELRLRRDSDRDIPLSAIFESDSLFAGAYIHNETLLSWFRPDVESKRVPTRFKTITETTMDKLRADALGDYNRMCRNVSRSYGKQINAMMMVEKGNAQKVVDRLTRAGLPEALMQHQQVLSAIQPKASIIDIIQEELGLNRCQAPKRKVQTASTIQYEFLQISPNWTSAHR